MGQPVCAAARPGVRLGPVAGGVPLRDGTRNRQQAAARPGFPRGAGAPRRRAQSGPGPGRCLPHQERRPWPTGRWCPAWRQVPSARPGTAVGRWRGVRRWPTCPVGLSPRACLAQEPAGSRCEGAVVTGPRCIRWARPSPAAGAAGSAAGARWGLEGAARSGRGLPAGWRWLGAAGLLGVPVILVILAAWSGMDRPVHAVPAPARPTVSPSTGVLSVLRCTADGDAGFRPTNPPAVLAPLDGRSDRKPSAARKVVAPGAMRILAERSCAEAGRGGVTVFASLRVCRQHGMVQPLPWQGSGFLLSAPAPAGHQHIGTHDHRTRRPGTGRGRQ